MLLAMGAVHHHLRRVGKRMKASMICETAEARDVHQIACLIGFGASCVNPYLALETIRELIEKGAVEPDFGKVTMSYKKALENGLLKIMSKMGISLVSSYRGAQIFEAIGIPRGSSRNASQARPRKSREWVTRRSRRALLAMRWPLEMQFRLRQASSMIRDTFGSGAAVSCMRSAAGDSEFSHFVGSRERQGGKG